MARTQRNKATERHFGVLKAKLAKLRRELITPKGGSSGPGEGFDVAKTGDARIGFVGEIGHTQSRKSTISLTVCFTKGSRLWGSRHY